MKRDSLEIHMDDTIHTTPRDCPPRVARVENWNEMAHVPFWNTLTHGGTVPAASKFCWTATLRRCMVLRRA